MGIIKISNSLFLCLVVVLVFADEGESGALPPRKKVVIQGHVDCSYCSKPGSDSIFEGTLLPGAVVKLRCNNTKGKTWEEETTTDKRGRYVMRPEKVTTWGAHNCRVWLVSSPRPECSIIFNPQPPGATLKAAAITNATSPFQLFTVHRLMFWPGPDACT